MTIILNGTTGITTPDIDSTGGLDAADLTGALPAIDGSKMYMLGGDGVDVNEYDLGTTNALTLPSSIQNPPSTVLTTNALVIYEFVTLDGGTTVNLIAEEVIAT